MDLHIITRADLVDPGRQRRPAILLTGGWPGEDRSGVVELDEVLDGGFAWIDREAVRLAGAAVPDPLGLPLPPAWVHALGLRYYLLKLLRIVVYFTTVRPLCAGDRLWVLAGRNDEDETRLVALLCQRAGAACHIERREKAETAVERTGSEETWCGALRRLAGRLVSAAARASSKALEMGPPRIFLCGNPRFLDPVCRALHERGCRQWWLYDRFAVKPFLRWQWRGVGQLTCEGELDGGVEQVPDVSLPELKYGGIDLRPLVAGWLAGRLASRGRDQARLERQIDAHFRQVKPAVLLVDEDATPMKRIALAAARRHGAESLVVQHGTPVARFGFAPLAADGIFAWGQSSREQFRRWEIPADRIFLTGCPAHDRLFRELRAAVSRRRLKSRAPAILLLATVPPRDDRPDLIEMHLTTRTYAEMVEAAFAAVAGVEGARLLVRPHPRSVGDPVLAAAAARHPGLAVKIVSGGTLAQSLRGVDCVLSCVSSAGVESTMAGLPVIQLIPRGAGPILPSDRWGVFGNASTAEELRVLLEQALGASGRTMRGDLRNVFAGLANVRSCDGPGDPCYGPFSVGQVGNLSDAGCDPGVANVRSCDGPGDPSYGPFRGAAVHNAAERIAEAVIGRAISTDSANHEQGQLRRTVGWIPRQTIGSR